MFEWSQNGTALEELYIPGTYVIETVYANSVTNQCNVSDVFTIFSQAVEFDQDLLDDIKSNLASCLNTKSIDLNPTSPNPPTPKLQTPSHPPPCRPHAAPPQ